MMQRQLHHGGDLQRASDEYGIPRGDWIDLSTGINPNGWPVPEIPACVWQRLPESPESLFNSAAEYYGCGRDQLLPVAGSQAVIQMLPTLIDAPRVAVPDMGYAEHRLAWQRAGAQLIEYPANSPPQALAEIARQVDLMLVINPNNPSGDRYPPDVLREVAAQLTSRQGWLLVDEAFMDLTPEQSLAEDTARYNLVLLRSLGKFFGLAGVRAGFVLGPATLLGSVARALGPWSVSAPALYLAERALADCHWQLHERKRLVASGKRLYELLANSELGGLAGGGLFVTLFTPAAPHYHHRLAQQGIWTRLLDNRVGVRFGLPANESQWQRLQTSVHLLMDR
ncbi:threonine-phosphate decarboxylase CobD [Aestuariirhabdus sp. LZHN29]|uniref:threonine-phosphate decarboxylase CobD n=1 Tax=Aestuariirhabdus sp. LZHN29 TaxID=3417462 RepID=UPI003CE9413C